MELRLCSPGANCAYTEHIGQELGLGGARAHGAERQTIGRVLGRNGIQHLARQGHALLSQISEELS